MTAVILAADEEAAREAAFNLGLPEWIYPLRPDHLHGIQFDLVVYVEGWRTSAIQTAATGVAVELRAEAHDADRLEQPRTATFLTAQLRARNAQLALKGLRSAKLAVAPFVSPESVLALAGLRPRPRSLWARIWRRLR